MTAEARYDEPLPLRPFVRPLWIFGSLLMMLDGLTTYLGLTAIEEGDDVREVNPLMSWGIEHLTLEGAVVAKGVIGIASIWILACAADHGRRWPWANRGLLMWKRQPVWKVQRASFWVLAFSIMITAIVVGNNVRSVVMLYSR